MLSVATNGGTRESFHINIPVDRVMTGAANQSQVLPEGMEWPQDEQLAGVRSELFKIRNARDVVIGVAARTVVENEASGVIDWMIHLPARGSLYFSMDSQAREGGYRIGELQAGSREFARLHGQLTERWIANTDSVDGAPAGRLELEASYVGQLVPESVE